MKVKDAIDITGPVDTAGSRIQVQARAGSGGGDIEVHVLSKDFAFGISDSPPPAGVQLGELPFAFDPDGSSHFDPYQSSNGLLVRLGNPLQTPFALWVFGTSGKRTGWFQLFVAGQTEDDDADFIIIGPP